MMERGVPRAKLLIVLGDKPSSGVARPDDADPLQLKLHGVHMIHMGNNPGLPFVRAASEPRWQNPGAPTRNDEDIPLPHYLIFGRVVLMIRHCCCALGWRTRAAALSQIRVADGEQVQAEEDLGSNLEPSNYPNVDVTV